MLYVAEYKRNGEHTLGMMVTLPVWSETQWFWLQLRSFDATFVDGWTIKSFLVLSCTGSDVDGPPPVVQGCAPSTRCRKPRRVHLFCVVISDGFSIRTSQPAAISLTVLGLMTQSVKLTTETVTTRSTRCSDATLKSHLWSIACCLSLLFFLLIFVACEFSWHHEKHNKPSQR